MEKINENPARYILTQAKSKGFLFKKEVEMLAVGDENGQPLTPYEYTSVSPYEDGFVSVYRKADQSLLDLDGKQVLPGYKLYRIYPRNGFLTLYSISERQPPETVLDGIWREPGDAPAPVPLSVSGRGLANAKQEILVDPKENTCLQVIGDIVLYGRASTAGPDYSEFGAGRLSGDRLVPVLPRQYNYMEFVSGRVVAAGRYVVTREREAASLTRDRVTETARKAFQLFDVDSGRPVSGKVFGEIHRTKHGNYSAVIYPHIRPEDLTHRQTAAEAFSGKGLLDFSDPKKAVLNDSFAFPN